MSVTNGVDVLAAMDVAMAWLKAWLRHYPDISNLFASEIADLQAARDAVAGLLAETEAALKDYEMLNKAAKLAGFHPFTLTPERLGKALAACRGAK